MRWLTWEVTTDKPMTVEDAMAHQNKMGYDPAGYGFYSFRAVKLDDGRYLNTWMCSGTCD